jgi:hypothetical protein
LPADDVWLKVHTLWVQCVTCLEEQFARPEQGAAQHISMIKLKQIAFDFTRPKIKDGL